MGSAKDAVTRKYIRLPKSIRQHTDPLVKNRGKATAVYKRKRAKGKKHVHHVLKRLMGVKKKK